MSGRTSAAAVFASRPRTPASERWHPESQWSPLNTELSAIFGPLREGMVRAHIESAREQAEREGILTPAERRALGWDQ